MNLKIIKSNKELVLGSDKLKSTFKDILTLDTNLRLLIIKDGHNPIERVFHLGHLDEDIEIEDGSKMYLAMVTALFNCENDSSEKSLVTMLYDSEFALVASENADTSTQMVIASDHYQFSDVGVSIKDIQNKVTLADYSEHSSGRLNGDVTTLFLLTELDFKKLAK